MKEGIHPAYHQATVTLSLIHIYVYKRKVLKTAHHGSGNSTTEEFLKTAAPDVYKRQAMNAEDFVENTGSSLHSYQVEKFRLYFSNAKGDRLGSETVKVRYNSNTSREKVIVEKILKGPGKDGNFPVISPNTEVRSVSVKDLSLIHI